MGKNGSQVHLPTSKYRPVGKATKKKKEDYLGKGTVLNVFPRFIHDIVMDPETLLVLFLLKILL